MKTPLTHLSAAIACCALLTVPTHADAGPMTGPIGKTKVSNSAVQGKVVGKDVIVAPAPAKGPADSRVTGKVPDLDVIIDPATRPAQSSRVKDVIGAKGVYIKFTAKRETGRIAIPAFLSTVSEAAIDVHYSISRKVRGRWTEIAAGDVTVPAGGVPRDVSWELKPTNDVVELKIDVTTGKPNPFAAPDATKTYKLKALKVSYDLNYATYGEDWVLAYERTGEVDTNKLRGDAARKRAEELAPYGFESKISIKTTNGIFTDFEEVRLLVRTPGTQTRTFDTAEEALEYSRVMKSLIQDGVAVWTRVTTE